MRCFVVYETGILFELPRELMEKLFFFSSFWVVNVMTACVLTHYLIHFSIAFLFFFAVTNKMTAGAKSFGSFFTGVVNKAGAKIKETVKDNVSDFACPNEFNVLIVAVLQSILGEFNKEQEAFIKDQSGKDGTAGVCPWIGHQNEDKIKEEILSLSGVSTKSPVIRSNFLILFSS